MKASSVTGAVGVLLLVALFSFSVTAVDKGQEATGIQVSNAEQNNLLGQAAITSATQTVTSNMAVTPAGIATSSNGAIATSAQGNTTTTNAAAETTTATTHAANSTTSSITTHATNVTTSPSNETTATTAHTTTATTHTANSTTSSVTTHATNVTTSPSNETTATTANTTTATTHTANSTTSSITTHATNVTTSPSNETTATTANTTTATTHTANSTTSNITTYAPNVTTTSPSNQTTPSPEPTISPQPSHPEVGNYSVKEKNNPCIMAQMGTQLIINPNDKNKGYFNIDPKSVNVNGRCGKSQSNMNLLFNGGYVKFIFTESKGYVYISSVAVLLHTPSSEYSGNVTGLQLNDAPLAKSFTCESSEVEMGGVMKLVFENIRMQAFDIKDGQFGQAEDCKTKNKKKIALIVGICVVVLIVVGIIIYLIYRRKKISGYERI